MLVKTCILFTRCFVVFQVSHPYNRMVLMLELKSLSFVFNVMLPALHIGDIILKAVLAFPILHMISFSEPP